MTANLREQVIQDHVLKCFTHGKLVRRDSAPPIKQEVKLVKELRRKINALESLRKNFQKQNAEIQTQSMGANSEVKAEQTLEAQQNSLSA